MNEASDKPDAPAIVPSLPPPAAAGLVTEVGRAKAALRHEIRDWLATVPMEERVRFSAEACGRLAEQEVWHSASAVLCYAPMSDELDIVPLIESALKSGKVVALPQFDRKARGYRACQITRNLHEVPIGSFGIREPGGHHPSFPMDQLDLILVPGLGFDLAGHRLGRGRGYYDQLLTGVRGVKCGLALDGQLRPQIPVERHDVLLDCILTPRRWLDFRARRCVNDLVG